MFNREDEISLERDIWKWALEKVAIEVSCGGLADIERGRVLGDILTIETKR
jgi:hypothetical protein